MAAIAVPLITALGPMIIDLIAGIVHPAAIAAELQHGPSTGPVKYGDVYQRVLRDLNSAAAAGQIPKELPSDESIKLIIQAVVSTMKISGAFEQPVVAQPVITPRNGGLTLKPGDSITITVGQ